MNCRLGLLLVLGALISCVRNPATGKQQLSLIPESQEIELGQQSSKEVAQTIGLYQDPKLQSYVDALGKRLAASSERPHLPWSFHVVDDASVNAFALPGGPVFVTRGILAHLTSEAELATVMGHEVGHIAARHSVNQMSKAELAQIGLGLGMILRPDLAQNYGQLAGAGLQLLFLKYSRDAENQADELGFRYALKDGYDVRVMKDLFVTLERVSQAGQGGRLPEWLATHPNPENRLSKTEERLQRVRGDFGGLVRNDRQYLQVVDGIVYGANPRQGFFRGNAFLHPDLKFKVEFPQGWKAQNQPQAVAAISPQQDAIVELGIAGKMPPEAAAQKFLSMQGIQGTNATQSTINGFPATSSYFQAQTQQGAVQGLVSFISYGGNTFQFVGYTPAGRLSAHDSTFKEVLGSFNSLNDPEALNVQPARIQLMRVPREMTIEQFNAQFPSSIPVDQLALINGVDKGSTLKAGQEMKRVVGGLPGGRLARTGR